MTREERLRAALAGTGLEDQAAELAALPASQVDLIVAGLKASHRAGREHERQVRRQRHAGKVEAREARRREDEEKARRTGRPEDREVVSGVQDTGYAAAFSRQAGAFAARAAFSPAALTEMLRFYAGKDAALAMAVAGLRAAGYSDAEIARAHGTSRNYIRQRYERVGCEPQVHETIMDGGAA